MLDVLVYIMKIDGSGWFLYKRRKERQVAHVVLPDARMWVLATEPMTELGEFGVYGSLLLDGNKLEISTMGDGSQSGVCVFPNGSSCDEWAYYRGTCGSTLQKSPTPALTVERSTEEQASGGYMPPGTTEEISDWWGVIKSTESGVSYDDYFERQDLGQIIYFGIDSMDPTVKLQIEALRNSGRIIHLYETLVSNVPDYNGSQIQVDRIEVEEMGED